MTSPIEAPNPAIFKSARYSANRAKHLAEMRRRQFGKSPVDLVLDQIKSKDSHVDLRDMSFGDPARYPGMGPYDAVHRFLRRFLNFHDNPQSCAKYSIWGDEQFIRQIRQGSANTEDGDLEVPDEVEVYPTAGVAGALRMICPAILLPPGEDGVADNVIVPKWTYLSHSAEAALALAEVRTCGLTREGQVDLDDMLGKIDQNTRAVILATVGNPLSTAMHPAIFDEMLKRLDAKQKELGHPIVLIADTIYEHFRRQREERIDAIQRIMRLNLEVPVIETSSFSKMFGLAGYRSGFYRFHMKDEGRFYDERKDLSTALNAVYGTSLCPVPVIIQKAIGYLYAAIKSNQPVEEDLAPLATVLISVKDLTLNRGGGDTHTMMPEEVPEDIVNRLGMDPKVWFTTSAIAKRARKLANPELGKYNVDVDTSKVEEIGEVLLRAGFIEKKEVEVKRAKMMEILTAAVLKYGRVEHKLYLGIDKAVSMDNVRNLDPRERDCIVQRCLEEMLETNLRRVDLIRGDINDLQQEFAVVDDEAQADDDTVKLVFYRLRENVSIPESARTEEGKLKLENISADHAWKQVAKQCKVPTEAELYEKEKKTRRKLFEERTDYFVKEIDKMGQEGLGVYLHPSMYDEDGKLVPERLNAFYVLFGFEKLRNHSCQAAKLVSIIKDLPLEPLPLLKFTPGEVFLSANDREPSDSYIRAVTLHPVEDMGEVLAVIREVATYLAAGESMPYQPPLEAAAYKEQEQRKAAAEQQSKPPSAAPENP
jgi:aspartate/methionine/tyrosine aminotransferase